MTKPKPKVEKVIKEVVVSEEAKKVVEPTLVIDTIDVVVGTPEEMKKETKVPDTVPVEAEQLLLKKIIIDNPIVPLFAIIRDTLDDSDPSIWNDVIKEWIRKDYYIQIYDLRDGYLTELGKLYARNEYGLVYQP